MPDPLSPPRHLTILSDDPTDRHPTWRHPDLVADAAPLGHDQVAQGKREAVVSFVASVAAREAVARALLPMYPTAEAAQSTARVVQTALLALARSL